jgi:hypothetical protein
MRLKEKNENKVLDKSPNRIFKHSESHKIWVPLLKELLQMVETSHFVFGFTSAKILGILI